MRKLDLSGNRLKKGDWVIMHNWLAVGGIPQCAEVVDVNPALHDPQPYVNDFIQVKAKGNMMMERSDYVTKISTEQAMLYKLESHV